MFSADSGKQIQVCVFLETPCASKVLANSLRGPSANTMERSPIPSPSPSPIIIGSIPRPTNHGLKQYKYNIHVHSTSNQFTLIHNESTIQHNQPLHSRVPHTQLRPYEGSPSHRYGSYITDYITGSPLRSPRFRSSNSHLINMVITMTMIKHNV